MYELYEYTLINVDKSSFQARRESAGALRGFGDLKKTRFGQNKGLVIPKSSVASLQAPCGASATSKKTRFGQNKGLDIPKSSVARCAGALRGFGDLKKNTFWPKQRAGYT